MGAATFQLESFERIEAGRAILLRVSGRWHADEPRRLSPPQLVVDAGQRRRTLSALPSLDEAAPFAASDAPRWRAAFAVPVGVLQSGEARYALESEGGTVELPPPQEVSRRATRSAAASRAADQPDSVRRDVELLQAERDELRSRAEAGATAERRCVELTQRLGELEPAREQLAAAAGRVAELEQALAQRDARLRKLEREVTRARSSAASRPVAADVADAAAPTSTGAEPAGDRRARAFVWVCWTLALVTSAYFVLRAGRNIPIQEDWHVIAAATGNQDGFWSWVWEPNNEHRVPIAKLLYVALFQLWPDFRVGMVFNLAALAAIAAAFVVFLRRLRGRTRWSDAFFPLIFLHLGNWENFGWSWQLTFVIAAAVAAAILMLLALPGPWTTRRAALLVGCLLVTPFTGATALPFAAAVAVAVLVGWRNLAGRARTVLAAGAGLTLLFSGLYFIDLPKSTWVPESPGLMTDVLTSGKFLALGLGPAAGAWWLCSILAVTAALASAAWLLWRARHHGGLALLAFLGAGVVLAVSLGRGRAGAVPFFGLPDRYVLVAIPVICAIYIVWDRFGGARMRRLGPAMLCGAMLLLLPLNTVYGAEWKDWYQERVETFQTDVATGVPLAELIRYRPLGWDPGEMWLGMQYMRVNKVGVFEKLRLIPPPVKAWAIDGFATGGGGWETLRGAESRARLVKRHGRPEIRWRYAATSRAAAAVGRRFDAPADWRGSGALAFTVAGQGSGRNVRVRLTIETPAGGLERFDTWFTDTTTAARTIVMPWNGFGRANARGVFVDVLRGPLPLTGIRSVTFIIGDRGPGVLRIQRLALTPGHPQLGWPLHSAAQRRSLRPLR